LDHPCTAKFYVSDKIINAAYVLLVLGPACNEYNKLTEELEVERACRNEAEKFASEVSLISLFQINKFE